MVSTSSADSQQSAFPRQSIGKLVSAPNKFQLNQRGFSLQADDGSINEVIMRYDYDTCTHSVSQYNFDRIIYSLIHYFKSFLSFSSGRPKHRQPTLLDTKKDSFSSNSSFIVSNKGLVRLTATNTKQMQSLTESSTPSMDIVSYHTDSRQDDTESVHSLSPI